MEATEELFECVGCGAECEGQGEIVTLFPGTLEEPPELGELCDECVEFQMAHEDDTEEQLAFARADYEEGLDYDPEPDFE